MGFMRIFNKPRQKPRPRQVADDCPQSGVYRPTLGVGRAPSERVRQRLVDCGIATRSKTRRVRMNSGEVEEEEGLPGRARYSPDLTERLVAPHRRSTLDPARFGPGPANFGPSARFGHGPVGRDERFSRAIRDDERDDREMNPRGKKAGKKGVAAGCATKGRRISEHDAAELNARRTGKKPTKKASKKTASGAQQHLKDREGSPGKKPGKKPGKTSRHEQRASALAAGRVALVTQLSTMKSELVALKKQITTGASGAAGSKRGAKAKNAAARKAHGRTTDMAKKKASASRKKAAKGKGKSKGKRKASKRKGSRANSRRNISEVLAEVLSGAGRRVTAGDDQANFTAARDALLDMANKAVDAQQDNLKKSRRQTVADRVVSAIKKAGKGVWGKEPKAPKGITASALEKIIAAALGNEDFVREAAAPSAARSKGKKKAAAAAAAPTSKKKKKKGKGKKKAAAGATANPKGKKRKGKKKASKKAKAKGGKKRKGKKRKSEHAGLARALSGAQSALLSETGELGALVRALKKAVEAKGKGGKKRKGKKKAKPEGKKKKAKGKRKGGKKRKSGKKKAKGKRKGKGKKKAGARRNSAFSSGGVEVTDFARRNSRRNPRIPGVSNLLDMIQGDPQDSGLVAKARHSVRPILQIAGGVGLGSLGASVGLMGLEKLGVSNRVARALAAGIGGAVGTWVAGKFGAWLSGERENEMTDVGTRMRGSAAAGAILSVGRVLLNGTASDNPIRALVGTTPQGLNDAVNMGDMLPGDPAFRDGGVRLHENSQEALYEGSPIVGAGMVTDEMSDMDDFAAPAMDDFAAPGMDDFATPAMGEPWDGRSSGAHDFGQDDVGLDHLDDFAAPGLGDFAAPGMGDDGMDDFATPAM